MLYAMGRERFGIVERKGLRDAGTATGQGKKRIIIGIYVQIAMATTRIIALILAQGVKGKVILRVVLVMEQNM